MKAFLLSLFLLLGSASRVGAADFYIDSNFPGGNLPGCGQASGTPCRTYSYWYTTGCTGGATGCADNLVAGDIIHFAPGLYPGDGNGQGFNIPFNGTAANPITYRCEGNRTCIIDGCENNSSGGQGGACSEVPLGNQCGIVNFGARLGNCETNSQTSSYIVMENFTIRGWTVEGVRLRANSHHIKVKNTTIDGQYSDSGSNVITLAGSHLTLLGDSIINCVFNSPTGCTYIYETDNVAAVGNVFGPIWHRGVGPGGTGGVAWPDPTCNENTCNRDCYTHQDGNRFLTDGNYADGCYDGLDHGVINNQSSPEELGIIRYNTTRDIADLVGGSRHMKLSGESLVPTRLINVYKNINYASTEARWDSGMWFGPISGASLVDHIDFWNNSSFSGPSWQSDITTQDLSIWTGSDSNGNVSKAFYNLFDGTSTLDSANLPVLGLFLGNCTQANCAWVGNNAWYAERGGSAKCIDWQPSDASFTSFTCTQFGTTFNSAGSNSANTHVDPLWTTRPARTIPAFKLQTTSPAVDTGDSFCNATADGSGNTVTVTCKGSIGFADLFFPDPKDWFGLTNDDCKGYGVRAIDDTNPGCFDIQIEGVSGVRQVTDSTNTTVTFNGAAGSWSAGAKVHLPWLGNAPDRGAAELDATGVVPTPTVTATPVPTVTVTPTGAAAVTATPTEGPVVCGLRETVLRVDSACVPGQTATPTPTPTPTETSVPGSTTTATPTVTITVTPEPTVTATPSGLQDWSGSFVAWWSLDETTGTRAKSGGSCSGTTCDLSDVDTQDRCVGTPDSCSDTTNKQQGAGAFLGNNTDARVNCVDATCGSQFEAATMSLLCWARVTSDDANDRLFDHMDAATGWQMARDGSDDSLACVYGDGTLTRQAKSATNTFPGSSFRHLACVYNGTLMQAYVNGAASGASDTHTLNTTVTSRVNIGGSGNNMGGQIDECGYTATVLTAQQICRICSCGIVGEQCACNGLDGTLYDNTGRNATECGNCALPACNATAP